MVALALPWFLDTGFLQPRNFPIDEQGIYPHCNVGFSCPPLAQHNTVQHISPLPSIPYTVLYCTVLYNIVQSRGISMYKRSHCVSPLFPCYCTVLYSNVQYSISLLPRFCILYCMVLYCANKGVGPTSGAHHDFSLAWPEAA
jgi:hypothetical protein